MSEPFIGEVRIFAGNFAPRSWAFCDGQLLPIAQNTALFSLLGTTYGGDGQATFALPDLQGRAAMHPGRGPGLTNRRLGERGGSESVSLNEGNLPSHNHNLQSGDAIANTAEPNNAMFADLPDDTPVYTASNPDSQMQSSTLGSVGGGVAHDNMQPYAVLNFIIALQGLYPSRS